MRGQASIRELAIKYANHALAVTGSLEGAIQLMAGQKRNWAPIVVFLSWIGLLGVLAVESPYIAQSESNVAFAVALGVVLTVMSIWLLRRGEG